MSISYWSLESSFGATAGLDGRDFIFAGETRGAQSIVRGNEKPQYGRFSLPNSGESSVSRGSTALMFKRGLKVDSREIAH